VSDARESLDSPFPRHAHPLMVPREEGLRNVKLVFGQVGESTPYHPASDKDHLELALAYNGLSLTKRFESFTFDLPGLGIPSNASGMSPNQLVTP
jgi:hypothetical protein